MATLAALSDRAARHFTRGSFTANVNPSRSRVRNFGIEHREARSADSYDAAAALASDGTVVEGHVWPKKVRRVSAMF